MQGLFLELAARELPFFVFLFAIRVPAVFVTAVHIFLCCHQNSRNLTQQGCISLPSSELIAAVCFVNRALRRSW